MRTRRAADLVATGFGLGDLPLAPGTWGSLGALAVLAPLRFASPLAFAAVLAVLVPVAVWSAGRAAGRRRDPGRVVVDEILGMGFTLAAVRTAAPVPLAAAFLLFRLFDILKPPPLRALERLPGGTGIVADDAGAAAWSALVLRCLNF